MKNHLTVEATIAALFVTVSGCSDSRLPLEPTVTPPGAPSAPPPVADFPPLTGLAVIYRRVTPSFIPGYSRFALYEDSTFALQYLRTDGEGRGFEYRGRYSLREPVITFSFNGSNSAGPWQAIGAIGEDTLTVRYNDVMSLADFEDGVYVRTPSPGELRHNLGRPGTRDSRHPRPIGERNKERPCVTHEVTGATGHHIHLHAPGGGVLRGHCRGALEAPGEHQRGVRGRPDKGEGELSRLEVRVTDDRGEAGLSRDLLSQHPRPHRRGSAALLRRSRLRQDISAIQSAM